MKERSRSPSGRFAAMAAYTGVKGYIVHMTCEGALNAIRDSSKKNHNVIAETCIQYLMLDASLYENNFESPLEVKKGEIFYNPKLSWNLEEFDN